MPIINSSFIVGAPQADGRLPVDETHATDDGQTYNYSYLLDQGLTDPQTVLEERAIVINVTLARRDAARLLVVGTEVPLTRYEFLDRMEPAERIAIRAFALTDAIAQDFLEMLNLSGNVYLALARPGLSYLAFKGLLTAERAAVIGAA